MPLHSEELKCQKCKLSFSQKSSLSRHRKRCLRDAIPPSRRKACAACSASKCRCDLKHPHCSGCALKGIQCKYEAISGAGLTRPSETTASCSPPNGTTSACTDQSLRSRPLENVLDCIKQDVTTHSLTFVVRVLNTYSSMIGHGYRSPPFIHHLQMKIIPSETLLSCAVHLTLWYDETANKAAVQRAISQEMDTIVNKLGQVDDTEILCAAQAYVLYAISVLFSSKKEKRDLPEDQKIILQLQALTLDLAATGLLLKAEQEHAVPIWHDWVLMAAKRRTVLVSHEICWAWSVQNGHEASLCREIGFMPTPDARVLWQAHDEGEFKSSYRTWLTKWGDGLHRMQDLVDVHPGIELPERTERWLEDVDELGMVLMSQVNMV